jgi:hypothetical protein
MKLRLTPRELRDLLAPGAQIDFSDGRPGPRVRLPLDLDAMTNDSDDPDDEVRDGNLRALLDDVNHAKAELDRTQLLLDERAEELKTLITTIGDLQRTPIAEAHRVIDRAGAQVLDVCRMFFLEVGSDAWYEGIRTGLRELVSTLGVEIDHESLEEHLKPQEAVPPRDAVPVISREALLETAETLAAELDEPSEAVRVVELLNKPFAAEDF